MEIAFDLDGTMVDTESTLRSCYMLAGVTPPPDFFGKPFHKWYEGSYAEGIAIRARKHAAYEQAVQDGGVARLPLGDLFIMLVELRNLSRELGPKSLHVVTGASKEGAGLVLNYLFPDSGGTLFKVHHGLSTEGKVLLLKSIGPDGGILFEDSPDVAEAVREQTRWTVCCTR